MNLLIIGGSGILSTDFTKKVLDEKQSVWLVNRGHKVQFLDSRAHLILADIRQEKINMLRKKISSQKYDVIVDFLSFEPAHVEKILQVAAGLFKQYIFISSATVYVKENENEIITERNKIGNKKWEYSYKKVLCEEYLKTTNVCYTIVRPYVTYGKSRIPFQIIPDGYHYTLLARIKAGKPILLYNGGEAVCTLTHTKDFAEILYHLLLNPHAFKENFHITSNERQTWKDVYFMICEIMQVEPNYVSATSEQIKKYLPESYEVLQGDKGTNMIFDNRKVLNVIPEQNYFQTTLKDGLTDSINYFIEHEQMQGIDFRWEGRVDYLIKRILGKTGLVCLPNTNAYSNKKILYYILCYQPLRGIYDLLRFLRRRLRNDKN